MPKCTAWIALVVTCVWSPATAQVTQKPLRAPRSADYLFAADVQDARALWVNPAGLGTYLQASVMGELVVDRLLGGDLALAQYTIGFNSRGFSAGYSHDGFSGIDSTSNSTIRVGLARGWGGLALGASLAFYSADVGQRGLDLGVRYELPTIPLAVSGVMRDIGEPQLRDSVVHARGVFAATAYLLERKASISGEVVAARRPALLSGYDVTYRAGASLRSGGQVPVGALVSFDLGNNLKVGRWSVGLSIGAIENQVIGTTSVIPGGGPSAVDRLALTGIATRRPPR